MATNWDEEPTSHEAARWRPVVERLGIKVLGIFDIPMLPVKASIDNTLWELRRRGNENYPEERQGR